MKITKLLAFVVVSAFILSACSNSENLLTETEQKNSLKSYKVKRDASGAYSLDYELENDVKSQSVKKRIQMNSIYTSQIFLVVVSKHKNYL
jgi:hypothetical protein